MADDSRWKIRGLGTDDSGWNYAVAANVIDTYILEGTDEVTSCLFSN